MPVPKVGQKRRDFPFPAVLVIVRFQELDQLGKDKPTVFKRLPGMALNVRIGQEVIDADLEVSDGEALAVSREM